jgi:hypothetical protein
LGINNGVEEEMLHAAIHAYPNPSTGRFAFNYPTQSMVGSLEVRDVSGHLVLRERLPQWSQTHMLHLSHQSAGIYHCTLRWGERAASIRIIVAP